jgi:hypothetical protein
MNEKELKDYIDRIEDRFLKWQEKWDEKLEALNARMWRLSIAVALAAGASGAAASEIIRAVSG